MPGTVQPATLPDIPAMPAAIPPNAAREKSGGGAGANLATRVYTRVKAEIFDFYLMPGDRFT
jgi:hypothetical protein